MIYELTVSMNPNINRVARGVVTSEIMKLGLSFPYRHKAVEVAARISELDGVMQVVVERRACERIALFVAGKRKSLAGRE